jgi:hypothetical protein
MLHIPRAKPMPSRCHLDADLQVLIRYRGDRRAVWLVQAIRGDVPTYLSWSLNEASQQTVRAFLGRCSALFTLS